MSSMSLRYIGAIRRVRGKICGENCGQLKRGLEMECHGRSWETLIKSVTSRKEMAGGTLMWKRWESLIRPLTSWMLWSSPPWEASLQGLTIVKGRGGCDRELTECLLMWSGCTSGRWLRLNSFRGELAIMSLSLPGCGRQQAIDGHSEPTTPSLITTRFVLLLVRHGLFQ